MNLILLFADDFIASETPSATRVRGAREGVVRLEGRRARHVAEIHRAEPGDTLCVGLAGGPIGEGRVRRVERDLLELYVTLDRDPPPPLPCTLLLALPRPLVLKRVLITATTMGVKHIVLLHSSRVEKSFWSSRALAPDALREQLVLGLEQARDTTLPTIERARRFRPFVEDELPAIAEGTRRLVAHPDPAAIPARAASSPATLAVGPEGGFVPSEIERLRAAGFAAVGLGERLLRVEAAVPALLARLF